MDDKHDECPVCYCTIADDVARSTTCQHFFCVPCLTTWRKQNSTCPVCRAEILCVEIFHPKMRTVMVRAAKKFEPPVDWAWVPLNVPPEQRRQVRDTQERSRPMDAMDWRWVRENLPASERRPPHPLQDYAGPAGATAYNWWLFNGNRRSNTGLE